MAKLCFKLFVVSAVSCFLLLLPALSLALPTSHIINVSRATTPTTSTTQTPVVTVSVDWTHIVRESKTTPTLQVVTNPLLAKDAAFESPIHDRAFQLLKDLNANYVRFVPWFPFPRRGVAELEPPSPAALGLCVGPVPQGYNLTIDCTSHGTITGISFASYAIPSRLTATNSGMCRGFVDDQLNQCVPFANTTDIVESACVGKKKCVIEVPKDTAVFGDPCPNVLKRLAVIAHCSSPFNYTSWNFSLLDPMMDDVMRATQSTTTTAQHTQSTTTTQQQTTTTTTTTATTTTTPKTTPKTSIPNFSTQPVWMYSPANNNNNSNTRVWPYVDSPNLNDGYVDVGVADDSDVRVNLLANYYKRLLSWYTKQGFEDEFGNTVSSGHQYNISMWEVFNEVTFEHNYTPETYCRDYDAITHAIREILPDIEFIGLAMGDHNNFDFYSHFLNASNHKPNTPLNWISYHMYANCGNTTSDPSQYSPSIFANGADIFLSEVVQIEEIRTQLAPNVRTAINEIGTFCGSDHPLVYWNAAAAYNVYLYLKLAELGIDVVGWSQLVAYPALPALGLESRDEPVAMLDWNTGEGNARYWSLKLMIDYSGPGDQMASTNISNISLIHAQSFVHHGQRTLVLLNKQFTDITVDLDIGDAKGNVLVVDEQTGFGPARSQPLESPFNLAPFAVCVVLLD